MSNEKLFFVFLGLFCLLFSYYLIKVNPRIVKRNWHAESEIIEKRLIFLSKFVGIFSFVCAIAFCVISVFFEKL
jgi:TRAP-type C4-dicarboxylate transport system permease small subunit